MTASSVVKQATKPATKPTGKKVEAKTKAGEAVVNTAPVQKTVQKSYTKAAPKAAAGHKHLTVDMINLLSPQQAAFVARGVEYHASKGRLALASTGSVMLTAAGRAYLLDRSGPGLMEKAKEGLTTGAKMPGGTEFDKAPAGFRFPYMAKARDLKAGGKESQAVFGALLA